MLEIIPAIMPENYDDLVLKATRVRELVPLAQIDIMDGKFVASKSWPYREAGTPSDPHFVSMTAQEEELPFFDELDYEIDLMISEPERHIDEWLPLGASRLIFHIEAIKDHELFWAHDIWKEGARDIGGQKVVEIGLAITPGTPLESVLPYGDRVDFIQCMGISRIGYQGQPFDERVLAMVNMIRNTYPNLPISIDGGVSMDTAADLVAAGASRLVAGSAIFGAEDIEAAVRALESC